MSKARQCPKLQERMIKNSAVIFIELRDGTISKPFSKELLTQKVYIGIFLLILNQSSQARNLKIVTYQLRKQSITIQIY
jgi:hypothetical protein